MKRLISIKLIKQEKDGSTTEADLFIVPIDNEYYVNINDINTITNVSSNLNLDNYTLSSYPIYCKD